MLRSIGTYLPPWGSARARVVGPDEDVVTLAVAAGRRALAGVASTRVRSVTIVSRDLPLLEGGNAAAILAGLDLDASTPVTEQLGGATSALDAVAAAGDDVLVIGADLKPAGAAAVLTAATDATDGASLIGGGRVQRSMPVVTRDARGNTSDYADPRLLRERGVAVSLERAGVTGKVSIVAGLTGAAALALTEGDAPVLPTVGASATLFAIAVLAERGGGGRILAVDQATVMVADLDAGRISVGRDELPPMVPGPGTLTPGGDISISLPAYDRAFDVKLRLEAARCTTCGTLSVPPRHRCIGCGSEEPTEMVPLPRDAEVHSQTTIHVAVPSKVTPYTLVIAELGDTGVRMLVQLTGDVAGSTKIGDRGSMVFRRVAVRSGVPDYGYAFFPNERTAVSA